jgi:hypothetical protein
LSVRGLGKGLFTTEDTEVTEREKIRGQGVRIRVVGKGGVETISG